jgi:hypothetical protein
MLAAIIVIAAIAYLAFLSNGRSVDMARSTHCRQSPDQPLSGVTTDARTGRTRRSGPVAVSR